MGAFHAYDIRGIYNVDFDKDTVYKVGYFIPQLLNVTKVLVGRDVRVSSDEIHEYLIKGITDAGADVYDLGLSTTPMVYYATARHGFGASVQITASHNPKEYNGMKVSRENALPVGFDSGLNTIQEWIQTRKPTPAAAKRGSVNQYDISQEYVDFLLKYKGDISNLKIGMDLSNGMAALFAEKIFGTQPIYIYDKPDGTFPNHEANPLVPENVVDLQKLVINNKCDIGVIYDGDADRVMFIDETGKFISPDLMIAVLGHYFLEKRGEKGIVLQDIRSSKAVGEYLTPMGAVMQTWRVGRAFAARKLREIDGIFGGELAGHYYFRDFFYSDSGLLASLLILDVVADFKRKGISFSQLISGICKYQNSGEINFKLEKKQEAMDAVRDYFMSHETPTAFYDFDGYRVEFPDWWFNIRPSNTEPYLRFICEASSIELLEDKVAQAREIIEGFAR
ncbi:MAG: phosphomannomutase/phosphoglucomutase [Bacteroidales bacterium]|nr:phosphomannomutase/phosphoglucomutase [Bacteroidales bacterium]MDD4669790.1 phosphomannomutase/phosphoglucomutase [Bacteroidales bacterium]